MRDVATLDALVPHLEGIEHACDRVGSTGLYPYAPSGDLQVDARQFPRASGYPEDPATGIAATALAFELLADGLITANEHTITIRQGRAMGRPSQITVRLDANDTRIDGCWLGGPVTTWRRHTRARSPPLSTGHTHAAARPGNTPANGRHPAPGLDPYLPVSNTAD